MPQSPVAIDLLEQILELNDEFLEAVSSCDWPAATALEGRRRTLLAELLSGPIEPEARTRIVAALRDMLQSDRSLVRNLGKARDHCSHRIFQMQLGRHATSSYNETSMIVHGTKTMQ